MRKQVQLSKDLKEAEPGVIVEQVFEEYTDFWLKSDRGFWLSQKRHFYVDSVHLYWGIVGTLYFLEGLESLAVAYSFESEHRR